MSTTYIAVPARPVSTSITAIYAVLTAITFMAVAAAPTPIYRLYRDTLGLTSFMITIFAVYSFTMIAAFLTIARLSDYVGRKPMILLALGLNAVALLLFFLAESASMLVAARAVARRRDGRRAGDARRGHYRYDAALGGNAQQRDGVRRSRAWRARLWRIRRLRALAQPSGLRRAALPDLVEMVVLAWTVETVSRKAGAWGGIRPRLTVPAAAAIPMARLFPLTLSAWALGGFYLSLMPSLMIEATGVRSPLVGAAVVSALMLSGGVSALVTRAFDAGKTVRGSSALLAAGVVLTLFAIAAGSPVGMFFSTIVAGVGFGASYGASLRVLLPLASSHERAGLLSAYFVESYLAFALPAVAAGLAAPRFGLVTTALYYGSTLALSALVTLAVETAFARR
jgi:hypothetical protein